MTGAASLDHALGLQDTDPAGPPLRIAVVIPLHNGVRHIEAAVLSVFRQTLPATEVIVVDDGSTDGGAGAAVVERLALAHPIRLVSRPNGGQSAARNWGVSQTTCDLVAFLDHDDVWYENHLAELARPFRRVSHPSLGWVYSDLDEVDEAGLMVCRSYLRTMSTPHPKRSVSDCLAQDMFILPSASLISRAAFVAVGGFDEALCGYEDDDLFLRLFRAGFAHVFLEQSLSQWRISVRSTSYSPRMTASRRLYAAKLLAAFPDEPRRARFYARDLIVPRFFGHAVFDHQAAAEARDWTGAELAWDEIREYARHNDGLGLRLVEAALLRHRSAAGRDADLSWQEAELLCRSGGQGAASLLAHALLGYKDALLTGDRGLVATAWRRLVAAARLAPGGGRLRLALALLRWPRAAQLAFAARRPARPLMLWAFRAQNGPGESR